MKRCHCPLKITTKVNNSVFGKPLCALILFAVAAVFAMALSPIASMGQDLLLPGPRTGADADAVRRMKDNLRNFHRSVTDSGSLFKKALPTDDLFAPSAGDLDLRFNPFVASYVGQIKAAVGQSDGKLVIGGTFASINGIVKYNLARFNADGSLDSAFFPRVSDAVNAVVLQPDGKILIGGSFSFVNGVGRNHVARLYPDGSLDTSFDPGGGTDNVVYGLALQSDGKIIIGGFFAIYNGTARGNLVRVSNTGAYDSSFISTASSTVYTVATQSDGKILVGGAFSGVNGVSSSRIARLNATDGSIDSSFILGSGASSTVRKVLQLSGGKIMIGGDFTTYKGTSAARIARINPDGSLDTTFNPGSSANSTVWEVTPLSSGKYLIGGAFTSYNGVSRGRIAQINSDGTLDTTFNPGSGFTAGTGGAVYSILVLPDGSIGVGGFFTQYNGVNRDIAAVLDVTGALDPDFALATVFQGKVKAVDRQYVGNEEKIAIAGTFNRVNGAVLNNIARFNLDGTLDPTFTPGTGANGEIYAMTHYNDKIMIGGSFTTYNGVSRNRIARLNGDGTLDTTFDPGSGANAAVSNFSGYYIVGSFTSYNGVSRPGIARLNDNGSLDTTFNPSAVPSGSYFEGIEGYGSGVVAGGQFSFSGYNSLIRLNYDGSIDNTFTPATDPNTGIYSLTLNYTFGDPKILIGGTFTTVGGVTQNNIARLNSNGSRDTTFTVGTGTSVGDDVEDIKYRNDGKIIIGGLINSFNGVPKSNIARLNENGTLDTSFATTSDNLVWDIEDIDGFDEGRSLVIGGDFLTINNVPRTGVANLLVEPLHNLSVCDYDGDGKTDVSVYRPSSGIWYLQRSQAGETAIQLGNSTDRIAPADFDGDGKTDIAVYRPSQGLWYTLNSSTSTYTTTQFGVAEDLPVPGDYDGDEKADLAVFRPSTGTWWINRSTAGLTAVQFGANGDIPAPGDYDGDLENDLVVFRPTNGVWYERRSNAGDFAIQFGNSTDRIVPSDYDGDLTTDVAIYRPSQGAWYVVNSSNGAYPVTFFGLSTDIPTPGDYDGDGKADIAIFRPSNGQWWLNRTNSGLTVVQYGSNGDKPTESAFGN